MHGGKREGAGRKNIPNSQKKRAKNIYINDSLLDEINSSKINNCSNFSQKCIELIKIGLGNLSTHKQCSNNDVSIHEPIAEYGLENLTSLSKSSKDLTFIDLFAGIGGIRKGFEDNNTKCVFSSEWDKYAAQTYEKNYGEKPQGDITKINEKDIPNHDILLAGFPCQPFSNIGKREGFSHETQGTLFFDVLRILKEKQPKMFLLENVKGLLTNDGGNTFKVILKSLNDLEYSIFHKVLDAQNFGLPQRRERVVIIGFRSDLRVLNFNFPIGNPEIRIPISNILEHNPEGYSISKHLQNSYLFKKNDGKPQLVDFNSDVQVNTLVASYHKIQRLTGTFVKDGDTGVRLFSELELKRLMGFPDNFTIPVSRTQMYRQFGNSVAVPMIKSVADKMKEKLFETEYTMNHNEFKHYHSQTEKAIL